jgi:hypothetical protein
MIKSQVHVLTTTGEPVYAETRSGQSTEIVEFFNPDTVAEETDQDDHMTIDLPVQTWTWLGEPTIITVSIVAGEIGEKQKHPCQRCGSETWTDVDYSGCSDCREVEE